MNPLLDLSARPVIAHRGASASAPENTMPAFERALRLGADALELDVRLTADAVAVVIHDPTLDRTSDRRGPVRAYTASQLAAADAGARFSTDGGRTCPFRAAGVRIPSLAEVLHAFPELPVLLEIKEVRAQEAVRRVLLDLKAAGRCVVASKYRAALGLFREAPFVRAASGEEIRRFYWGIALGRGPTSVDYRLLSVPERHRGLPVPTGRFVAAARRLGCPVHVWTVNSAGAARRLWERQVSGIITNVPDVMRGELHGS